LKALFRQIQADFTLDSSFRGPLVTVHLHETPFRVALETMLQASGLPLTYRYEHGIYSIIPRIEILTGPLFPARPRLPSRYAKMAEVRAYSGIIIL